MALHTGEPRLAEEGYHGLGVHLAARLCQVGAGGQILLSESTRAVVGDDLPDGVSLRGPGRARAEGLRHALPVYELVVDGVSSRCRRGRPPLRVRASPRTRCCCARASSGCCEQSGFEVVGQVDNPDDLVRRVGFSKPDVAIIDIRMPPTHTDEGLQAARRIRERHPDVGVLVLSQYVEAEYATGAPQRAHRGHRLPAQGHGSRTSRSSPTRCAASRPAARRSTPRSSPSWWAGRRVDDPLAALTAARAGGARADGRGPLQPRHRRAAGRHRAGRREARHQHLRQARPDGDARRSPPGAAVLTFLETDRKKRPAGWRAARCVGAPDGESVARASCMRDGSASNRNSRQPLQRLGQVPVPVAQELHRGGQEHAADDGGVDQDRRRPARYRTP